MRILAIVALTATVLYGTAAGAATWKYLDKTQPIDIFAKYAKDIKQVITNSVSSADPDLEFSLSTTFLIGEMVIRCIEEKRYSRKDRKIIEETSCYRLER